MRTRWPAYLIVVGLIGAFPSTALAAPHYSDWGTPVNLGCGVVNSASNDFGPGISKNGLSLYFASNRQDPSKPPDIYVAQRPSVDSPWGTPTAVPNVNTQWVENVVSLSRDGHWMFFNSDRPGGFGDVDIWAAYRTHVHDDFHWQTPVNLGAEVNSSAFEAGASYFENDNGAPLLYFGRGNSTLTQGTTSDIWVAELLSDGTFGNAYAVAELNSPSGDQRPSIRFDGLEIFFFSNRTGGLGGTDLWVATRPSVQDHWGVPANLGSPVNTGLSEFNPHISGNGLALYFASTRNSPEDGACGGFDLYVTTRTRVPAAE